MKRWAVALTAGLLVGAVALAACGGDGGDGDKTATGTKTSKTAAATTKAGTPGKTGTAASGTPGAAGTTASGTPAAGGTAGATGGTPGADATPRPVVTLEGSGNTPVASDAPVTPTGSERESIAVEDGDVPEDIIGGDIDAEPEVLTDLPEPPPGATIDPPTITAANTGVGNIQVFVDLKASEPGIQSSRTINVGDVIRVGLVISNVPTEGLAAFNFRLDYDKRVVVAPTIINGSSLSRNPDINENGIATGGDGWNCLLPAPEGDADDPGGHTGDGDPATGQAVISCFAAPPMDYRSGDIVFVTIQFQAIASGTTTLAFPDEDTYWFDSLINQLGSCGATPPTIPCNGATLTVQ